MCAVSKSQNAPQMIVGIDLGTTHTVVSYADISQGVGAAEVKLFSIPQLIDAGEIAERPLLPSFRYHPSDSEMSDADLQLPWLRHAIAGERYLVGEWARQLGAKVEGRLISSAKSWLCHTGVDRDAPLLPWGAAEEVEKVSPIDASASYLAHVRDAWNHAFPQQSLEQQQIIVTIPASFDEAARAYTVEAARRAGLANILLLEEPQAVCYDWVHRHRQDFAQQLQQSRLLMVCDIGGGTTDLSLIQVSPDSKHPQQLVLDRVGVGDHLMLGGDNLDLALARIAEPRITGNGKPLNAASLAQLVQQCRQAKETLLRPDAPESVNVTLLGAGSRLIGGARSTQLTREEVHQVALDGFLPVVDIQSRPQRTRSAVVEFGLPYEPDPAISHHLAAFIMDHQQACRKAMGLEEGIAVPDAVLFNGGLFNSDLVAQRLQEQFQHWGQQSPLVLDNGHPDLSVAYGAVAYGLARQGEGVRIGGGSARSFFLQVEAANREEAATQAVCVLPKGSLEGDELRLHERRFALRVGHPVRFHLLSSVMDEHFEPGQVVTLDDEHFLHLPPLVSALEGGSGNRQEVEVELAAQLTEVGTLQLECVALDDPDKRWQVEFQLRKPSLESLSQSDLPKRFPEAVDAILEIFGPSKKQVDPKQVKSLRASLEKLLGPKEEWTTPLLREMFSVLWEHRKRRRRSAQHERVWFNLVGYCLRPGYGYPLDDWRMEQLWPLYQQKLQFDKEKQAWAEWWTLWRRVAGGLEPAHHEKILKDISKYINPGSARNTKVQAELKNRSYEDIVRLAGVLEQIPPERKVELGQWLLKRLQKSSETDTSWWSLGRIGSRKPLIASQHKVVPVETAEKWLKQLIQQDWQKKRNVALAATLIARMTGDRTLDISPEMRQQVVDALMENKAPTSWIEMVQQVMDLESSDQKSVFGESLPPGIKLLNPSD